MPRQPLVEVFGFPISDQSEEAKRHRHHRLCPFNNRVPSCTKDKIDDPLGVCSIYEGEVPTIVCPVRFREAWHIASDAAEIFFPAGAHWTSLAEVRLKDVDGKSAGNIDLVLVAYDEQRNITDFGSLEIQGVYISGNLRRPFVHYMEDPLTGANMDWSHGKHYPRADYLSSSRKRLAPQLIYKGGILHSWGKKMAVAIDQSFLAELPELPQVDRDQADLTWLVYDLIFDETTRRYKLNKHSTIHTKFAPVLERITTARPGPESDFKAVLQRKLQEKLSGLPTEDSGLEIADILEVPAE